MNAMLDRMQVIAGRIVLAWRTLNAASGRILLGVELH